MTRRNQQLRGSDSPRINFSTITTVFWLMINLIFMYFVTRLALGWSLKETQELTSYMIGPEYADIMAWTIQLTPQILLMLRVMIDSKYGRWGLVAAAIAFNVVDFGTNLIAISSMSRLTPGEYMTPLFQGITAADLADWFMVFIALAITWAEEIIALQIGFAAHQVALILASFNISPPEFLAIGENYARAASSMASYSHD